MDKLCNVVEIVEILADAVILGNVVEVLKHMSDNDMDMDEQIIPAGDKPCPIQGPSIDVAS